MWTFVDHHRYPRSPEAFEAYLRTITPGDLSYKKASTELEKARFKKAIEKMWTFVDHHRYPRSPGAFEAYLRTITPGDLSYKEASAELEKARFKPYQDRNTREAFAEYVAKYPTSPISAELRERYILEAGPFRDFTAALEALVNFRTATSVGMNLKEYSHRLIDAKIAVEGAYGRSGQVWPSGARASIASALAAYESALKVWNWKIENIEYHSESYKHGYDYSERDETVMAWLGQCPDAAVRPAHGWWMGVWIPDMVIQYFWAAASIQLDDAAAYL